MILSACPHRRVEPWARLAAVIFGICIGVGLYQLGKLVASWLS